MDPETTLQRYARYLADVNEGGMRALQANPDSNDTECLDRVAATNANIIALADGDSYTTAPEINTAELVSKMQVMTFDFNDEMEKCGGNEFLIVMDNFSNRWKDATGGAMSLATQIGTGWKNRDSSFWIAWDTMIKDRGTTDYSYKNLGEGVILLFSQIIKFDGPALKPEVAPTNV